MLWIAKMVTSRRVGAIRQLNLKLL